MNIIVVVKELYLSYFILFWNYGIGIGFKKVSRPGGRKKEGVS